VEMKSISNEGGRMGGMGGRDVRKMLADIKNERMGFGEKPDWIIVRATIWMFRHENFAYQACPTEVNGRACNKKVTPSTAGGEGFYCEKCGRVRAGLRVPLHAQLPGGGPLPSPGPSARTVWQGHLQDALAGIAGQAW